jgi:hypothetical protein
MNGTVNITAPTLNLGAELITRGISTALFQLAAAELSLHRRNCKARLISCRALDSTRGRSPTPLSFPSMSLTARWLHFVNPESFRG